MEFSGFFGIFVRRKLVFLKKNDYYTHSLRYVCSHGCKENEKKIGVLVSVLHSVKKCVRPVGYVMLGWLVMAFVVGLGLVL